MGWYRSKNNCSSQCGDGIVVGDEECDDGNTDNFDGCSSSCVVEVGWTCNSTRAESEIPESICRTICGDGIRVGPETCDDGDLLSDDGCSSICQVECGFSCTFSDGLDKCIAECGDGIRARVEECDDENADSGDGCSQDCRIESGFSCQSIPCERSSCIDLTEIRDAGQIESYELIQTDCSGRQIQMTWTHAYLNLVNVFEIKCTSDAEFDWATNLTTAVCIDFVCHFSPAESFDPGTQLFCTIRAQVSRMGWTPETGQKVVVLGPPSPPRSLDIQHRSTFASLSTTLWRFTWSGPADHGDASQVEDASREPILKYIVEISCASQAHEFSVAGDVTSLHLYAHWEDVTGQDSVAMQFEIISSEDYPGFSLACRRGDQVSLRVNSETELCKGLWSSKVTKRAMGFPGQVCDLQSAEMIEGLRLSWTPPIGLEFGKIGDVVLAGYKVESSLCEDFNRLQEACYFVSSIVHFSGEQKVEFTLTKSVLTVPGTSYWIRVTSYNEIGLGPTGCSILQDFMIMPTIILPASFPVWISNGRDCEDQEYRHVWTGDTFSHDRLTLKIWGLPDGLEGDNLHCDITFENGNQLQTSAQRGTTIERTTKLQVSFPPSNCMETCYATVACGAGTKSFHFTAAYFSYSHPSVISVFPSDGPPNKGSVVKMLLSDFSGPRTKHSARLPDNLLTAYEDPSYPLTVLVQCQSDPGENDGSFVEVNAAATLEVSSMRSVALASPGMSLFDLTVEIPPSPCKDAGVAHLALQFCSDKMRLGEFQYVGDKVCSVHPPAAVIDAGTGGASLTAVLCNIESACDPITVNLVVGNMKYPCSISTSYYDAASQTLTIEVTTPELDKSLAGVLQLQFEGCRSQVLSFDWEYLSPPEPEIRHEMDDCVSYLSDSSTTELMIIHGTHYCAFSVSANGRQQALSSSVRGVTVHLQLTFNPRQMGIGDHTFAVKGRTRLLSGLGECDSSEDFIGDVKICIKDFSKPALIDIAPACVSQKGGTVVLLGVSGASTLIDNVCVQLDGKTYNPLIGLVPASEWGDVGSAAYADVMRKTSQLSHASEALAVEYSSVISKATDDSVHSAIVVVLKMPGQLNQGNLIGRILKCGQATPAIQFTLNVFGPDPELPVRAIALTGDQIPSGGVDGGTVLIVDLHNFPILSDFSNMSVIFGDAEARLLRFIRSDCSYTRISVEVPPCLPGETEVKILYKHYTGTFRFLCVDDVIPSVRYFSPSWIYADGGCEITAELYNLPSLCTSEAASDLEMSIESAGVKIAVPDISVIEYKQDHIVFAFSSGPSYPGVAEASISICGKISRPFSIVYVENPSQAPSITLSPERGKCRGDGKVSIILTSMKQSCSAHDDIRIKFGSVLLSALDSDVKIASSLSSDTTTLSTKLLIDVPSLDAKGEVDVEVWYASDRSKKAIATFHCEDYMVPQVISKCPSFVCKDARPSHVQVSVENLGQEIVLPCRFSNGAVTVQMAWEQTVPLSMLVRDMLTSTVLYGIQYEIYYQYPDDHTGCKDTGCGILLESGIGNIVNYVPGDEHYLIVARLAGYYTSYYTVYVGLHESSSTSFFMVQTLERGQDRVVLRWPHSPDLDLWVYKRDNSSKSVGWSTLGQSQSYGDGFITLDVDMTDGPGVETTQFMNLNSGTFEVWVNHYDDRFTSEDVSIYPASVDVYCSECLADGETEEKAGYVKSLTQIAADIPATGKKWWKVGEFTWTSSATPKWTSCTSLCYADNAPQTTSTLSHAAFAQKPARKKSASLHPVSRGARRRSVPENCEIGVGTSDLSLKISSSSVGTFRFNTPCVQGATSCQTIPLEFTFVDCEARRITSFEPVAETLHGRTEMMVRVNNLPAATIAQGIKVDFSGVQVTASSISGSTFSESIVRVVIPPFNTSVTFLPRLLVAGQVLNFPETFTYLNTPNPSCEKVRPSWVYTSTQSRVTLSLQHFPGIRDQSELTAQFEWSGGFTLTATIESVRKVDKSLPDLKVQDIEIDVLTPTGSRVMDGTAMIRLFHRKYLANSAMCHGFVFANSGMPRISEISGSGNSGTSHLAIGMTTPVDISLKIERAPDPAAISGYAVIIGESEVQIKSATFDSQAQTASILFESYIVNSEQTMDGIVVFGAPLGDCSSACCAEGSCATSCSNFKTACFALNYYDDAKTLLVVDSNLRGPSSGGEPFRLKIINLPVPSRELDASILSSRLAVLWGADEVLGQLEVQSWTRQQVQLVLTPPRWNLEDGFGQERVDVRVKHLDRPDLVLTFAYLYEALKPRIGNVQTTSGLDIDDTEVFLTVDAFPYPSSVTVTFGHIELPSSAVSVWPASTTKQSFISFKCPAPVPAGRYTVRITPGCSGTSGMHASFTYDKIDSSMPRFTSLERIIVGACKDYLPGIRLVNLHVDENTVIQASFYDYSDSGSLIAKELVSLSGDDASLIIAQPSGIMPGLYVMVIEITNQETVLELPSLEYEVYECNIPRISSFAPTKIPSATTACGKTLPLASNISVVVANIPQDEEVYALVGTLAAMADVVSRHDIATCAGDESDCRRTQIVFTLPVLDFPGRQQVALYTSSDVPLTFDVEYVTPCDLDYFCEEKLMIPNIRMLLQFPSIDCDVRYCINPSQISEPRIVSVAPTKGFTAGGTTVVVEMTGMPVFSAADLVVEVGSGASMMSSQITFFLQEASSSLEESKGMLHLRTPSVPVDSDLLTFVIKTRVCSEEIMVSFSFQYLPVIIGPAAVSSYSPTTLCQSNNLDLFVELQNVPQLFQPFNTSLIRVQVQGREDQAVASVIASDRSKTTIVVRASGPWQLGNLLVRLFAAEVGSGGAPVISIPVFSPPVASVTSVYPTSGKSEVLNVVRVKVAHTPLGLATSTVTASLAMGSNKQYRIDVFSVTNLTRSACSGQCCSLIEVELGCPPLNSEDQKLGGKGLITIAFTGMISASFSFTFFSAGSPSLELVMPRKQTLCEQGIAPISFFLRNFPSATCYETSSCAAEAEAGNLEVFIGRRSSNITLVQDTGGMLLIEAISPTFGFAGALSGAISATDLSGQDKSASFTILFEAPVPHLEPIDGPVTGGSIITVTVYGWKEATAAVSSEADLTVTFDNQEGKVVSLLSIVSSGSNSIVRVLVRTPPAETPGLASCEIRTVNRAMVSQFNFEYFKQPEIMSISTQKATLNGKTNSLDGRSVQVLIRNFPKVLSPRDVLIKFGEITCDGQNCGVLRIELSLDGVFLTLSVPSHDTPGDIVLSVKHVGAVTIPQGLCRGNPHATFTVSEKKANIGFAFFVPLPAIITTKWCSACWEGRRCIQMGRCGDFTLPLVNKVPLKSDGGALTVFARDLCFMHYDAVDGRVSDEDASRVSLNLGTSFAGFQRVSFVEGDLTVLEFFVPPVSTAAYLDSTLSVHPHSRLIPCKAEFRLTRFDEDLQITCKDCMACSDGLTSHHISTSNVEFDPDVSAAEQMSVRFGSAPDATPVSLQSIDGRNASLTVVAPPCSTCAFVDGKIVIPLTVTLKSDPAARLSTDFTYWSPPTIQSALMCPSGTMLYVKFDQRTDRARMSASDLKCSMILDPVSIPKLGQDPECKWSSDISLDIYLGSGASVLPGDPIALKSGTLRNLNSLCQASSSRVLVAPPRILKRPSFTLSGSESIDPCAELTISALYVNPRPLTFRWGCLNDDLLDRAIRGQNGSTLHLGPGTPEMSEMDKQYQISIQATDFLGTTSEIMVFKVLKKGWPGPLLVFSPPSLTIYRDEQFVVSVRAAFSNCPVPRERITFSWSQVSGPEISTQYFRAGSQFGLPAGVLDACEEYSIVVQASMETDPSKVSEAFYTIKVLSRPLIAQIWGGGILRASALRQFSLNADQSRDPDLEVGSDQGLQFEWSCTVTEGEISTQCLRADGGILELDNTPSITIDSETLLPTFDAPYLFSVIVSKSFANSCYKPMAKAKMPVYLDEEEIPLVSVSSDSGAMHADGYRILNVNDRMVFEGRCTTSNEPYDLRWEFSPTVNLEAFEFFGSRSQTILLPSSMGVFESGNVYTVTLRCTDSSQATSYTEMTIMLNAPPKGPSCAACLIGEEGCLKSGAPVFDKFKYCCDNWADPDSPLEYQFGYSGSFEGEVTEVLFDWNTASCIDLSLPSGEISLKARVRDALGAESNWMMDFLIVSNPIPLSFDIHDCLESIPLTTATYRIYTGAPSAARCLHENQCGSLVDSGSLQTSSLVNLMEPGQYLVVIQAATYAGIALDVTAIKRPVEVSACLLKSLPVNQDQVVLAWDHEADLDLWVDAVWRSGGARYIGYQQKVGTNGASTITLDMDNQNGLYGPEIARFNNAANGIFEVWVNLYSEDCSDVFTSDLVDNSPATLDIYCHRCLDDQGKDVAGWVTTVTQSMHGMPDQGAAWWKVGHFEAPASGGQRLQWRTCKSNCYPARLVRLYINPYDLTRQDVLRSALYTVYTDYPGSTCESDPNWVDADLDSCEFYDANPEFCEAAVDYAVNGVDATYRCCSCGGRGPDTHVNCENSMGCGTALATGSGSVPVYVPVCKNYLVVVNLVGYYTGYMVTEVESMGSTLNVNMVKVLSTNMSRVVLRWDYKSDLDMEASAYLGSGDCFDSTGHGLVRWIPSQNLFTHGDSEIHLDKYSGDGTKGPETMILKRLTTGSVEVWINMYTASFTRDVVSSSPATVDIFCQSCLNDEGERSSGWVASITQTVSDLPVDGASWWRVGQYIMKETGLQWQTCFAGCYTNDRQVRVFVTPRDLQTSNILSGVTYKLFSGFPEPYIGCEETASCGRLVAEASADDELHITPNTEVLGVLQLSGYHTGYFKTIADELGTRQCTNLVERMATDQDRVVLSWGCSADLDLGVDATFSMSSSAWIDWESKYTMHMGTIVSLDLDNTDGVHGPETISFDSISQGTFEVWVNLYTVDNSGKFQDDLVRSCPATVDVFCHRCINDQGALRAGWVTSVTQSTDDVPIAGSAWWKVGEFVALSSGGMKQWTTCASGCYMQRTVRLSLWTYELVRQTPALGGGTFNLYVPDPESKCQSDEEWVDDEGDGCAEYDLNPEYCESAVEASCRCCMCGGGKPVTYANCELSSSCGELVASWSADEWAPVAVDQAYLVVVSLAGFYNTYTMSTTVLAAQNLDVYMVKRLEQDQQRAVLKWHSEKWDLDLVTIGYFGTGSTENVLVDYTSPSSVNGGVTISLDIDSRDGSIPEAMSWYGLSSIKDGVSEVWVNNYAGSDSGFGDGSGFGSGLSQDISVDILCNGCLDSQDGLVESVIPSACDLQQEWWLVGEFVVYDGSVKWQACTAHCYWSARTSRIVVQADDIISGDAISEYSYKVYSEYSLPFDRCEETSSCGDLVSEGSSNVAAHAIPGQTYLVVLSCEGYYSEYFEYYVSDSGARVHSNLVQVLRLDESRVVLNWNSSHDYDLWVNAMPVSDSASYIYWGDDMFKTLQTTISLDLDSKDGRKGPETTMLKGLARGIFEIWIHFFTDKDTGVFTKELVESSPALVDVFCNRCHDGGTSRREISQWTSGLPEDGAAWWKVGHFNVTADGSVKWQMCTSNCFEKTSTRTVRFSLQANDALNGGLALESARFRFYTDFPEDYLGCEVSSCGTLVEDVSDCGGFSSSCQAMVLYDRNYLVVVTKSGFYTGYSTAMAGIAGAQQSTNMFETLGAKQTRVVLSWDSEIDLDLTISFRDADTLSAQWVNWEQDRWESGVDNIASSIELQLDNTDGKDGPETTIFENLGTGIFEVWVNLYSDDDSAVFSDALIEEAFAVVDVFCHSCKDEKGESKSGWVTSIAQGAEDLSDSRASWWKVGEFVSEQAGNMFEVKWKGCQSECYSRWAPFEIVSIGISAVNMVTGDDLSNVAVKVYEDFPEPYQGCAMSSSCGTLVAEGDISILVRSKSTYLVVVSRAGYYQSYEKSYVGTTDMPISTMMVEILDTNQDRIVLSWDYDQIQDLDLGVYAKFASGSVAFVNWEDDKRTFEHEGSTIALDLDNPDEDGNVGPETIRFEGIKMGTFEVWVNLYTREGPDVFFTPALVAQSPATVSVLCHDCVDERGQSVQGFVASVTQSAANVPATALWWKVGNFVAPGPNGKRLQWIKCASECYDNNGPEGGNRRSLAKRVKSLPVLAPLSHGLQNKLSNDLNAFARPGEPVSLSGPSVLSSWDGYHNISAAVRPGISRGGQRSPRIKSINKEAHSLLQSGLSRTTHTVNRVEYIRLARRMQEGKHLQTSDGQNPAGLNTESIRRLAKEKAVPSLRTRKDPADNRHRKISPFGPSPFGIPPGLGNGKHSIGATRKYTPRNESLALRIALAKANATSISSAFQLMHPERPQVRRNRKIRQTPPVEPESPLRKLLNAQGESEIWISTANLLQEILDTQNYALINEVSSAIAMEIDQMYVNGLDTAGGSASKKSYILSILESAMSMAIKNEGYICEVLGVSKVMAANPYLVNSDAIPVLSNIAKTLTLEPSLKSIPPHCAKSALTVFSQSLTASGEQRCGASKISDAILVELLNDLEVSMKALMRTSLGSLMTGQTMELTPSTKEIHVTQQISRKTIATLFGSEVTMTAASGDMPGQFVTGSVSYKLPSELAQSPAVRTGEVTVQFTTFHNAPKVNGVQPISPIVKLSLANDKEEISVTGLTKPIEITIPLVNQEVCGQDLSTLAGVECRYWTGSEYSSDGCQAQRIDAKNVKCKCTHLTSFVVTPIVPECEAGFTGEPGDCTPCAAGTYKPVAGRAACVACPAQSYSESPRIICRCNAGYTGPDGVVCNACPAGKFKVQPGAAACTNCEAGKYSTSIASMINNCESCPAGTFSTNAGAGKAAACLLCVEGKYSTSLAASSAASCLDCRAGKYSMSSGASSAETCIQCSKGKYSSTSGAGSPNTCTDCAAGKYSTVSASQTSADCQECPAGRPLAAAGSDAETDCREQSAPCAKGYTGEPGNCIQCAAGTFKSTEGSAGCNPCPPNSGSVEGSRTW